MRTGRIATKQSKKNGQPQPPRPLSEMTPMGRKLYELAQKYVASTKRRLSVDDVNRLLAKRRGGVCR